MSEEIKMRSREEIMEDYIGCQEREDSGLLLEVLLDIRDQNKDIIEWMDTIDSRIIDFHNQVVE